MCGCCTYRGWELQTCCVKIDLVQTMVLLRVWDAVSPNGLCGLAYIVAESSNRVFVFLFEAYVCV